MQTIPNLPSEVECQRLLTTWLMGIRRQCPTCARRCTKGFGYYWCAQCRRKLRPRALTWLAGSNLPARQLLTLVLCWQQKASPGTVRLCTGLSYPTIRRWYRRFPAHLPQDAAALRGLVEVDEAFFGRQKHRNQAIVVGAVERHTNRLRLSVVADRQTETLEEFVLGAVTSDSLVHTDAWGGYATLEHYGLGHEPCNHSRGNFGPTNHIEAVWSSQKRQLRRMYGQIRTEHLPLFLVEWEGRYNYPGLFTCPLTFLQATVVPD